MFTGGGATGQSYIILRADQTLGVTMYDGIKSTAYRSNVDASVVTLGAWHRIEWYQDLDAGTLKWWLDGTLRGSHTGVTNAASFDMFQFSPTFGGNLGAVKAQTDHYWYDHARISAR
jgi:hypothetical protein